MILISIPSTGNCILLCPSQCFSSAGTGLGAWAPVNLDHPATFNTLAMDLELKKKILDDLDRFVRRKEYYRRVGKAWKRG